MIDYLLKFPSQAVAEQFGISQGFASLDENGEAQPTTASHAHALCVIGEHEGDGNYWVLFRGVADIPVPQEATQYIDWASDMDTPRPETSPQTTWA